jgi:hypothetical protein
MANGQDTENNAAETETVDPKLANLVNSAVSSQLKRHMKGFGDQFGALLDEKLAALRTTSAPAAPAAPAVPTNSAGAPAANDETQKEIADLRLELKQQKQRAAEKEVFADVRSLLAGKVRPEAMDTAIKLLKADGLIKINARDGSAMFKHADGDLDLSEGIAEWLKGEGAMFVPAPTAKKPQIRGPNRAPARLAPGTSDENLTPAQKSLRALSARGLSISD